MRLFTRRSPLLKLTKHYLKNMKDHGSSTKHFAREGLLRPSRELRFEVRLEGPFEKENKLNRTNVHLEKETRSREEGPLEEGI